MILHHHCKSVFINTTQTHICPLEYGRMERLKEERPRDERVSDDMETLRRHRMQINTRRAKDKKTTKSCAHVCAVRKKPPNPTSLLGSCFSVFRFSVFVFLAFISGACVLAEFITYTNLESNTKILHDFHLKTTFV